MLPSISFEPHDITILIYPRINSEKNPTYFLIKQILMCHLQILKSCVLQGSCYAFSTSAIPPEAAMATLRLWPRMSSARENPDVGHVFIFRVRPAQGFIYELGKGISHEKWGFMVVGGGGRGGDGWRVTGEEVLLLLLLMMMMMMMMMLVMIVVMSVVVVVLLTIISNNADLKIMLHWWGIIDLSLGLKNIMNNVPLEKHIVLSEVRLAYLPTWCSISIAWKKGIPTHFQNHPITRSYRYPSSRYFQQCMGMRSSIAGSNDLNSSASVVIPEKMTSKTHVELRVAHLGN